MSWRWYESYQPSRPKAAKGGIKAQSKRGSFGTSWWAKRWIAVLESFNIGARLGRGRTYARQGQVLSINIDKGLVEAKVQGSRSKPYDITIKVKGLSDADWKKLAEEISRQAIFAAKLLAGEMPQDIEQAFEKAGLSLFPQKIGDLETNCSCPDWSNPCKHIAAVYYLLGEEFDRDPFLLFKLRGLRREEFIELLGHDQEIQTTQAIQQIEIETRTSEIEAKTGESEARTGEEKAVSKSRRKSAAAGAKKDLPLQPEPMTSKTRQPGYPQPESLQHEPLTCDITGFWGGTGLPDNLFGEVRTPPISAALPKRLGNFPFWRGEQKFLEAIEPVYVQASTAGMELFLGEWVAGRKVGGD